MVHCPIFLKKLESFTQNKSGITIIELLIVIAFLAVLGVLLLVALNPQVQLSKSRDARRKADLQKLKNPLEDYYNDKQCYPEKLEDLVSYYLGRIPLDPLTKQPYLYYNPSCDKYWIYVNLEYEKDPEIVRVGCQNGCGPGGAGNYDYGVSSPNVRLETGGGGGGGCGGDWWACQGIYCNNFGPTEPSCTGSGVGYCGDSGCGGGCSAANCCRGC